MISYQEETKMKHNIHFILRIAAVALCAMMLLTASACGEDTPDVSSEDSVTNSLLHSRRRRMR